MIHAGETLAGNLAPTGGDDPRPRTVGDLTIKAAISLVLKPLVAELRQRRASLQSDTGPEAIHGVRVALRRIRAVSRLIEPLFAEGDAKWVRHEFKGLTRQFGELRDLDVLLAHLAEAGRRPRGRRQAVLEDAARQARERAARIAPGLAASARATAVVEGLWAWVAEAEARTTIASAQSWRIHVAPVLARQDARVRKAGANIGRLDVEERHRLRRRIKALRYASEAVSVLYAPEPHGQYLAALAKVGHILGQMNDEAVGARLAERLCEGGGALRSSDRQRASRLSEAWAVLLSCTPGWLADHAAETVPAEPASFGAGR